MLTLNKCFTAPAPPVTGTGPRWDATELQNAIRGWTLWLLGDVTPRDLEQFSLRTNEEPLTLTGWELPRQTPVSYVAAPGTVYVSSWHPAGDGLPPRAGLCVMAYRDAMDSSGAPVPIPHGHIFDPVEGYFRPWVSGRPLMVERHALPGRAVHWRRHAGGVPRFGEGHPWHPRVSYAALADLCPSL